jgi:hypothetical protein
MFHVGDQNRVAGLKFESQRHGIYSVRGIECEDDFILRGGIDKIGDYAAGTFNSFIRISLDAVVNFIREPVTAPAAAATRIPGIVIIDRVNYLLRHERGAGAVHVDRRLPVTQLF